MDHISTDTAVRFSDDFRSGFPRAEEQGGWQVQPVGALPAGDGVATTSGDGLRVVPTGVNPMTGLPAFAVTTAQQVQGGEGTRDHVKWTAMPRHTSSYGFPGYDMPAGGSLTVEATLAVAVHGIDRHPFGPAVSDIHTDPRLGVGSLLAADVETFSVFGFLVTNRRIYANYERLRAPGTDYAAYAYAVPLEERMPGRPDTLAVTVDAARGTAAWTVNGTEALTVERIGRRSVDRSMMLLDHGGTEEDLRPRQLVPVMGMFSLLDGAFGDSGSGLVRVDSTPGHYWDPRKGYPVEQGFHDEAGLPGNRLFGQGVQLTIRRIRMYAG